MKKQIEKSLSIIDDNLGLLESEISNIRSYTQDENIRTSLSELEAHLLDCYFFKNELLSYCESNEVIE